VFFLSQDDRFMIKTLRKSEVQVLLRMLPEYYYHVRTYENTLITKFFGLHRVKPSSGQKFHFVVMGRPSLLLRERGHFSPARYFVEEVITGYDETDLYKTWLRANAMRSPQEKNTRLENMTWRIWNLARKKKEVRLFALV